MGDETNVREAVPFFRVAEIERSRRFYIDGLGFVMTRSWSPEGQLRWCSLKLGDASVMLQTRQATMPATHEAVSICFQCRDALALYRQFRARGLDASRPFVGNNMWVTMVVDPDGFRLEFHSPTDAGEDSEYDDASAS